MVSGVWALIALSFGLLVYIAAGVLATSLPIGLRVRVGRFYYKQSMKSYRQVAIVRRILGGLELYPIAIDDEQKTANVTLDSGLLSDDKKLPFRDPDGRIKRLFNKPVAVVVEELPAAVSPELAELGYWANEKASRDGLLRADGGQHKVDPYVPVDDGLRVVDPISALHIASKNTKPENVKTVEEITKERFSEYGNRIGLAETAGVITGFAVGLGGVALLAYVRDSLLDGQGASPPDGGVVPLDVTVDLAMQVLVVVL